MGEWVKCTVGDVVTLHYGKGLPLSKRIEGKVPVYSSAGLIGFHDKILVETEGLIIGRKGTIGKVYKSEKPFFAIDTTYYVKPDIGKYYINFLYYLFQQLGLEDLNEDSAVPGLNRNTAYSQEIYFPPLAEQKAIAEVLSSLDDKIDLLHRQNKTLEALAETLFRQWFIQEAEEDGTLGDIVEFNPRRKLLKGADATYVEMSSLSNDSSVVRTWRRRHYTSGMRFMNDDVLLARITPCLENGKTCFVNFLNQEEIGWGSTEFIVMRAKQNYNPFISYLIAKNEEFRNFAIINMSGSSGRQRVDATRLSQYFLKIPSQVQVAKLNNILESITPKIKSNLFQIRSLAKFRDTLLPKLMSGQVRVNYCRGKEA